jgi:hypothetical protein
MQQSHAQMRRQSPISELGYFLGAGAAKRGPMARKLFLRALSTTFESWQSWPKHHAHVTGPVLCAARFYLSAAGGV